MEIYGNQQPRSAMTNQGGPEALIAGFICADICVQTQTPSKKSISFKTSEWLS